MCEDDRAFGIQKVLWWVLVGNLAVAVAKLIYGALSGSLSMRADGIHSLADSASNIIGLTGMRFASKPPDAEHPYGHKKIEIIGSWGIGALILIGMGKMIFEVFSPFGNSARPEIGPGGFAVALGTLMVNGAVTIWERKKGIELKSPILIADARHTLSDMFATVSVLISLIAIRYGFFQADRIAALFIVVLIGVIAGTIFVKGGGVFLDRSMVDPEAVEKTARSVQGVTDCHRVRSRGLEGFVSVDFHILLEDKLSLSESHKITHQVEDKIKKQFPEIIEVLIHTEPASDGREEQPWETPPRFLES